MDISRKTKLPKSIAALALVALASLCAWTSNPADTVYSFDGLGSYQEQQDTSRQLKVRKNKKRQRHRRRQRRNKENKHEPALPDVTVCGRAANNIGSAEDLALQQQYATCPEFDTQTPIVVIEGHRTFGRTANQLRSFLNAIQYTQDNQYQLGIMHNSWPMDVVLQFFMANGEGAWDAQVIETALCVKIIHKVEELEGRKVIQKKALELFYYLSSSPPEIYVASQLYTLRTLFQHYNTGDGHDHHGKQVGNMCSGIDSLFGQKDRTSAVYSVIHLRHMEGHGGMYMEAQADFSGCDPLGALEMRPDYIKSILAPLDMLKHPIVVITDGQDKWAMQRLKADPQIGPMIRIVSASSEDCWIGGDMTLATMANVFIGNPVSTFSLFIARSRNALGFGDNYLYRVKDENGEWTMACDDECLYKNKSGHSYSHFDQAQILLRKTRSRERARERAALRTK